MRMETSMEISRPKMTSISTIQALTLKMQKSTGKMHKDNNKIQRNMIMPRIFTKLGLLLVAKNKNRMMKILEQIVQVTQKKKQNGVEATLKKKKTFTINISKVICSDSTRIPNTPKRDGKANLPQTPNLNTTTLIPFLISSVNKGKICIKKKKKCIKNTNLTKIHLSMRKIVDSIQDQTCLVAPVTKHTSNN